MIARAHVVFLGQDAPLTRAVANRLRSELGDVLVVFEDPVPTRDFLRRRVKRLGVVTVAGQILFAKLVTPVLRRRAAERIDEIRRTAELDESPIADAIRVSSVNSDEMRGLLRDALPDVVVVTGTRIIGKATLDATPAPFVNLHAGITPGYRGVNGAYWALVEGRPDLVGTTIHFIDEGIDTGTIIEQATFDVDRHRDSWVTYPYLHVAAGLGPLVDAARRALAGELEGRPERTDLDSRLRYPPTLWGYLAGRLTHKAR